ncbi:MAG: alpha/beta fold hydrolase [Candidatus Rokubacteria bacterium]|nr:alpha/beta fold hydrolase [Candidatus Rokubacteria bacterium]MBI3826420.1 alpha/beta fold hydrolase [Candidatus Rokubacteria bacterium]
MPFARTDDGVNLFYEAAGQGLPLVFVHEFAGDHRSWLPQINFFSRRYRTIAFNARGYPPSDVPDGVQRYSQDRATDDVRAVLDALGIAKAHVCGLSMGGYATLHFGLRHPGRALSLTVAGAGYGSVLAEREKFRADVAQTMRQFEADGMAQVAEMYARGPTRVQFRDKDPTGWAAFRDMLAGGSARGHALTMGGVQAARPSIFELEDGLVKLEVPTLIMTGDEDEPCLEPALFMKRTIPTAALVVLPKSGHTINLEEPEAFNRALLDFLTAVAAGRWTRRNEASQTGSAILPAPTKGTR